MYAKPWALTTPDGRMNHWLALSIAIVAEVVATTALGLLISVFTATQTAAVFGTAIVTMLPATQFSGMLQPVATLEGGAWLFGTLFPTTHFLKISVGAFTKGLAFPELLPFILATAAFVPVFLALGVAFLPKQER